MTTHSAGNEKDSGAAAHQGSKRMSNDWYRSPITDYMNVSTITYPKGWKHTVSELLDNNAMVDVMFYKPVHRSFFRKGREPDDWIIQLYVESEDFQDATVDSTQFNSIAVRSKYVIDAIKPVLSSINYPLPENANDQVRFFAPFHDLFFAQGRLLETLKYAGLGNVKEKQLRSFIAVVQVVLKRINHSIRELAGKKVIDFESLWTLFPQGSYAVATINSLPHIAQVIENQGEILTTGPGSKRKDTRYLPFKFSNFEFDGVNFGSHQYQVEFYEFKGNSSISSLEYRPLKFEERFEDNHLVQKAIVRGRKSLEYQSFHHCQYTGKCHAVRVKAEPGEREINGRVIVDAFQVRKTSGVSYLGFLAHSEHLIMPVPTKRQEVYSGMRSLFLSTMTRRPTVEEQEKRKAFFRQYDEYLMLIKPTLPMWSLDHNDWYWADISKIEPLSFLNDPMDSLVDSTSKAFGLLNILVNNKLNLMLGAPPTDKQQIERHQSNPLVVCFSGPQGTGKTATAQAIAELHQRPLFSISAPPAGKSLGDMVVQFTQTLENAASWGAIVLFDDAQHVLGLNKTEIFYDQLHVGIDLSKYMEQYRGIIFLTKRDDQRLLPDILRQVKAHIDFKPFDCKKREKIWQKLLSGSPLNLSKDVIKEMSEWDLNGHDIKHLYSNIDLMFSHTNSEASDEEPISAKVLEELKDLTLVPNEEWTRCRSRSNSPVREVKENSGATRSDD